MHAGVAGHRYIFPKLGVQSVQQRDAIVRVGLNEAPEVDTALFVDRLGRTTVLTRKRGATVWAVPATLVVQRMRHIGDEKYAHVPNATTSVLDGVIERVAPRWHW